MPLEAGTAAGAGAMAAQDGTDYLILGRIDYEAAARSSSNEPW